MEERGGKGEEILQAALELIAEHGYHGAPMSMIADKAGVAAGTIYRYFESKDVLIAELHRGLEDKIEAVLLDNFPFEKTVREKIFYMVKAVIEYFIAHPLHFRYMEQYYNSPYGISKHRERFLGKAGRQHILMDIFEEGISQHILKDLPKVLQFALIIGPLISLIRDHILGFIVMDEDLIKTATTACWDAIKL